MVLVCSIEANQMEDRGMNKMWLVRHLEVTRQLVLEDLRVVKVNILLACLLLICQMHGGAYNRDGTLPSSHDVL